jgi:dTDP-4-amino-4,6-dideoxygalactose transaminase
MDPIMALAHEHGLFVVEDCAQAHGATYKGRPVGSIGHVGAWSFCQDKIMPTGGEGGMATTNDHVLWSRMWSYKDHGKSWEAVYEREHPPGYRWLHESFGTNWRMTEMQAAIGRIQLKRLPGWVRTRRRNAEVLTAAFHTIPAFRLTVPPSSIGHAYYKYYVFVRPEHLSRGWSRDRIVAEITDRGVPCGSGSCPELYLERAFRDAGYGPAERLPVAKELGTTSLMFQVHPTLTVSDMERAATVVKDVMALASA